MAFSRVVGSEARGQAAMYTEVKLIALRGAREAPPLEACKGAEEWMKMSAIGKGSGRCLISTAAVGPGWTGRERRVMGHVVLMAWHPCVLVSAPGAEGRWLQRSWMGTSSLRPIGRRPVAVKRKVGVALCVAYNAPSVETARPYRWRASAR